MARQYQKTNWQNTPSTATPLSADNLNHIEDGIYNLETKVENNASAVSDLQSGKVDKVIGKGLSKNDFTDAYKTQIDDNTQDISINKSLIQSNTQSINNLYDIKVNKVTGKGLSTNDFTNNDVDKLRNDTYTKSETRGLVSKAYHPAGTIHVEDLVSSVLVNANLNNVYNLDGDGTTSNLFIEGAGHPLKDGTNIGVINFGTDESPNILFDDLGGFVDLSGYATTSAMNTALAGKVDKVSGKGLSTNDFTDVYKSQIETNQGNILTLFDDKVDKEAGKGLSSNDFTSRYINAINDNTDNISDNTTAIQANANNITALQNNKVDKVVGKGLSTNDFTNNFKKGIAISQELAYDRATIPQPNLDADFHTVNGERTVIYQGNAYSFHTMTYNPISKKYVYGIMCSPVYQGGLFFCEVDNPASDRHNWLDTTTFPTDILINGDIYTAVMPTGEAYYVSYSYNNNDEKELVYCNALDSSRLDYWIKTEIIINSIFNIGNYIFYVADNKVYKYEFAHGSVELDFDTVPFAYTYGGGRCIALTKNQYNVISAFMSYDGIEWTKVNFPSINKTNKPSGLIYDHGIFLFYQEDDEYVITSKDGFSWEKHKLSIDMTEFRENFMIFDEIGWGGGIFYACVNSVDEGHYDDYTIWTSQDGYTWEQTVKYLEDEIDNKTDYYNGTYLISVAQNLYYPTYRLDGVYGKGDVYTKSESNSLVIANPTDEAEGTLNKLKVNGTTYNLPQGGETNVQADWTETDPTSSAYIQHKPNLGTAASKDVPTSGNATATQVVMGNDTRLTNARPASDVSSWAKASTKPTYTASEVGAYTKTESDNKYVAKETGKGLSTNDYTTADKNKLAGIEAEANKTVVDSAMSDSSTNPLQNKVVTSNIKAINTNGAKNLLPMTLANIKANNTSGTWSGNAYTVNGFTFTIQTDSDGNVTGIKVNGTASAAIDFYFAKGSIIVPNNAVFSTNVTKATGFDEYIGTIGISSGYDYVSVSSGTYTNCGLYFVSGYTANNLTFYPMIRLASDTDSTFQPYAKTNLELTNALQGAKTTSGNPLTIEDAAPVNAVNLSMDLEPIQDLHGYDHPWVGGAGKNKLPMTVDAIKALNATGTWSGNNYTLNGITFTIQTDSNNNVIGIKINGTKNGDSTIFNLANYTASSGDKLNGCNDTTSNTYYIYARGGSSVCRNSDVTISNNDVGVARLYAIAVINNTAISNAIVYPMIRLATETDSSFAPYTNICPISGRSEVAIQRVGKNLFGGIKFANALHAKSDYGTIDTTNKTVSFNRTSNYSPIFEYPFKENTQYTFIYSGNTESVNQKNTSILFEYTDGTESAAVNLSSNIKGTYAIQSTNGKTIKSIDLRWANGANAVLYYDECGLFEGVLTTGDFEPYAGKTYTIQLGETVYGGQLDVTRGKMVVDKGYVEFDGSSDESFSLQSINEYGIANFPIDGTMFNPLPKGTDYITNRLTRQFTTVANTKTAGFYIGGGTFYIRLTSQDASTVAELRTFLSNNTLQVCYELATPYTIDLTPQQIKMLENINTIYTDYEGDTITIEYQPNNAIGEAVRAVEESYDPEFAVRPVLKKKAFSGTTDSDGSVTLINASDIPSNHRIIPLHITDMTIGGSAGTYFVEYKPYNSGDSVKGYCYFYMSGSQMFPVGKAITGNFYYYDLEV